MIKLPVCSHDEKGARMRASVSPHAAAGAHGISAARRMGYSTTARNPPESGLLYQAAAGGPYNRRSGRACVPGGQVPCSRAKNSLFSGNLAPTRPRPARLPHRDTALADAAAQRTGRDVAPQDLVARGQGAAVRHRHPQAQQQNPGGKASNFDLPAELDDPVGRDAEEFGGIQRQVGQEDEQAVAPTEDGGTPRRRPQFLAADKE